MEALRDVEEWRKTVTYEFGQRGSILFHEFRQLAEMQHRRWKSLIEWGCIASRSLVSVCRRFRDNRREVSSLSDVFAQYRSLLWSLQREEEERREMASLHQEKARLRLLWVDEQKRVNRMEYEMRDLELAGASEAELEEVILLLPFAHMPVSS